MKSVIIFGLIYLLILPLVAIGCDSSAQSSPTVITTVIPPAERPPDIDISLDAFAEQKTIINHVELTYPGSFILRLGSNASTGYQWGDADISDTAVLTQAHHIYSEPENPDVVGAPGTEVWTFDAQKTGNAVITVNYGQPWEGGEKAVYTLTLNVTVK